ncbi:MAG: hypothetical protein M3O24_02105 [Thermoproteota archaeon]|nr:hypothetical protein [Thermoproteota archaeon]
MDYNDYVAALSKYKKVEATEQEKALLFKIMNDLDISSQLGSYLKFRDKNHSVEIQSLAARLVAQGLLEEKKGMLLRGLRRYKLTSAGIFYVLSETRSYSPILLKKYKDDPVLLTLLYPYFEDDTINSTTARLYSVITQYLLQCCKTTSYWLEDLNPKNAEHTREITTGLALELEWNAKALGFKIAIMYIESNILSTNLKSESGDASVAYYELERKMKEALPRDRKFMGLLNKVNKEFSDGYTELTDMR